jgi:hypothetical protein
MNIQDVKLILNRSSDEDFQGEHLQIGVECPGKSTVVLSPNLEYAIQANVQTTAACCIKSVSEDALRAPRKIDALFAAETVSN